MNKISIVIILLITLFSTQTLAQNKHKPDPIFEQNLLFKIGTLFSYEANLSTEISALSEPDPENGWDCDDDTCTQNLNFPIHCLVLRAAQPFKSDVFSQIDCYAPRHPNPNLDEIMSTTASIAGFYFVYNNKLFYFKDLRNVISRYEYNDTIIRTNTITLYKFLIEAVRKQNEKPAFPENLQPFDKTNCNEDDICISEKLEKNDDQWCYTTSASASDDSESQICLSKQGFTKYTNTFSGAMEQDLEVTLKNTQQTTIKQWLDFYMNRFKTP